MAKPGYECRIPPYKVFNYILCRLYTGCQWEQLPIDNCPDDPTKKKPTIMRSTNTMVSGPRWKFEACLSASIISISEQLDLHYVNLDGSHAPAKKGGEAVACQGRKKVKTSNVLPITNAKGFILATTGIVAGNHHDF